MARLTIFYVYYLYYADGSIADVGRSNNPEARMRIKSKRNNCQFTMKLSDPMTFKESCEFELTEQARLRPSLMKRLVSSPGMFGKRIPHTKQHIAAIVAARIGYRHSLDTKRKLSEAKKGKFHSLESRQRMSIARTGATRSEATKKIMSVGAYARWDRQHLQQSGWGHPWRLKDLFDANPMENVR